MARNLQVGGRVFVPASRLGMLDHPTAFYVTHVVEVGPRSVKVDMPQGAVSGWIGNSLCRTNIGILIITVGDLKSETALLDPLSKSVLQFCRLLASDDYLRSVKLRSLAELRAIWQVEQAAYSHVILVGHGKGDALNFAVDAWANVEKISDAISVNGAAPKTFLSLCCETGYKAFGGQFSELPICGEFIGPFHDVHGAIASQFAQTFLAYHLLEGETVAVAFRHARANVPGSTSFRLWRGGTLEAGPKG